MRRHAANRHRNGRRRQQRRRSPPARSRDGATGVPDARHARLLSETHAGTTWPAFCPIELQNVALIDAPYVRLRDLTPSLTSTRVPNASCECCGSRSWRALCSNGRPCDRWFRSSSPSGTTPCACSAASRASSRNDYPRALIEIIVVDNDSTDGSARAARDYGAIVLTASGHVGGGAAQPRRARRARQHHRLRRLRSRDRSATGSQTAVEVLSDPQRRRDRLLRYLTQPTPNWVQQQYDGLRARPARREDVTWLGSGNLAVKRAAFERVGGFNAVADGVRRRRPLQSAAPGRAPHRRRPASAQRSLRRSRER